MQKTNLNIDYALNSGNLDAKEKLTPKKLDSHITEPLSPIFLCSPSNQFPTNQCPGDVITGLLSSFDTMTPKLKLNLLNFLFRRIVLDFGGIEFFKFVTPDFLDTSIQGMKGLFDENKQNLVLKLARCFEKQGEDFRMPMNRMPFGLLDYNVNFFSSQYTQKLGIEEQYAEWLATMYAHFW